MSGGLTPQPATRVVVVQGPLQALMASAAILHGGTEDDAVRNVLVIGGLYATSSVGLEEASRDCARAVRWQSTMRVGVGQPFPHAALASEDVGEVWCARNWQGLNRDALDAFPDARQVCYGDGIGIVDNDRGRSAPQFDEVRVVVPQPETADALAGQDLELVSTAALRTCVDAARAGAPAVVAADKALAVFADGGILALLGNLTEAGMTTLRGELRQAHTLLTRLAHPGQPVVLKPHPRASLGQASRLARTLRKEGHPVRVIVPGAGGFYPVELFEELVAAVSLVEPGLSSSAVSLRVLFDVDARVTLTRSLARRTLFPDVWNRASGTAEHHRRTLRELASWDGRSALDAPPRLDASRWQVLAAALPRRLLGWSPREPSGPSDALEGIGQVEAVHRALSAGDGSLSAGVRPSTHAPVWRRLGDRLPGRRLSRSSATLTAEEVEEIVEARADTLSRRDRAATTSLRYSPRP